MSACDAPRPIMLPALTGLRGAAAIWVLLSHALPRVPALDSVLSEMGYVGVDIFFVLSGFIISHVHVRDFAALSRPGIFDFLALRLSRIYPVHLVMIAVAILYACLLAGLGVDVVDNPRFSLASLAANLVLVQAWGWIDHGSWNVISWSISAEWLAYLYFPLLAFFLLHASHRWPGLMLVMLIAAFVVFARAVARYDLDVTSRWAAIRVVLEFSAGVCIYRLWSRQAGGGALHGWLADLAALAILLGAASGSYLLTAVPVFVLVPALAAGRGLVARFLQTGTMMYLGAISYSVYMVHSLVLEIMFAPLTYTRLGQIGTWPRAALLVAALIAIGIAARLMNRLVEIPSRSALRRMWLG